MTQPLGNQTKEAMSPKPSILPLILAALFGGGVVFILSQLQFKAWIDFSDSHDAPVIDVNPTPSPQPSLKPSAQPSPSAIATVRPLKTIPDGLVVSNLSPSPVRVVLLSSQSGQVKPTQKKNNPTTVKAYRMPVHWDFAPNEGGQSGLLLSLPKGKLKLAPGDVLTAFALDGSRKYWGPYVVGKTAMPTKATKSSAWQLKLDP